MPPDACGSGRELLGKFRTAPPRFSPDFSRGIPTNGKLPVGNSIRTSRLCKFDEHCGTYLRILKMRCRGGESSSLPTPDLGRFANFLLK